MQTDGYKRNKPATAGNSKIAGNPKTRQEFRKQILKERDALPAEWRAAAGKKIAKRVYGLKKVKGAKNIFLYASFRSEVPTDVLIKKFLSEGKKVALPKVQDGEMEFYFIRSLAELQEGYQGIREPYGWQDTLALPGKEDVMLVPGAVFDCRGGRFGYGGGFYDRYLAKYAGDCPYLVGLCYRMQLMRRRLPVQPHDWRVDCIVTERGSVYAKFLRNLGSHLLPELFEGAFEAVLELLFGLLGNLF